MEENIRKFLLKVCDVNLMKTTAWNHHSITNTSGNLYNNTTTPKNTGGRVGGENIGVVGNWFHTNLSTAIILSSMSKKVKNNIDRKTRSSKYPFYCTYLVCAKFLRRLSVLYRLIKGSILSNNIESLVMCKYFF